MERLRTLNTPKKGWFHIILEQSCAGTHLMLILCMFLTLSPWINPELLLRFLQRSMFWMMVVENLFAAKV